MNHRKVIEIIQGRATSDGDGVKLLRIFGGRGPERFDPFLLFDEFGSEVKADYIGGFPPHPHRGFETITYMLEGKMEHQDHMGNIGLLGDGGVQWMTAGRGVIHSEMPKQTQDKMRGFQLWLNLPAKSKMQTARYEDVAPSAIPVFTLPEADIKAIAGKAQFNQQALQGYFDVIDTEARYFDVALKAQQSLTVDLEAGLNTLVYAYDNDIKLGEEHVHLKEKSVARLSDKGSLVLTNTSDTSARFLILAGKPLKEPIAQYGPFVMNTQHEIEQAVSDYKAGILTD